jgi:hypothetical protein
MTPEPVRHLSDQEWAVVLELYRQDNFSLAGAIREMRIRAAAAKAALKKRKTVGKPAAPKG